MAKKYTYEVNGVESGVVPNVGEVENGRIESDRPLVGPQFKLVSNDNVDQITGVEPQENSQDVIGPDQPINQGSTE